jgi:lipopolysaccharide biosynthesis regulator YciM
MRPYFTLLFIVGFYLNLIQAQNRSSQSYALIIGISKYEDPKITSLKHAHKDAAAFADFCTSPSGLNIPMDRMRTLTDEKASYWNIVDGLDWLKNNAQKDDQVYIYFAGHGDMESKELKYGYLLAHDSRYMNYLGRSLSLDLLNKTAHTLTVNRKAKVFLITDACHSGKLAGVDFNGSNLVALNLMQLVSNNEVRITSCNEGELSYEDDVWGNGRGAFSYFLGKGMAGEADGVNGKKDGSITVGEIKAFLNGKVPENVRNVKRAKQNPVVMGTETAILNSFIQSPGHQNNTIEVNLSNEIPSEIGSRDVSGQPSNILEEDILNQIDPKVRDKNIDFKILASKSSSDIADVLLEELIASKKYHKKTLYSAQSQQMVAKALFDEVQHIIDLYLSGDEAELEKRRYYNQVDKPYDQYPYMLDIAIKLLPKDHYLIPSLQMQRQYLAGLNYRLQSLFSENYKVYLDTALLYQHKALSVDTGAAYIHNELGILNNINGRVNIAIHHFEKAILVAPLWSLPYSNIANSYYKKRDFVTAKKYVDMAFQKQTTLQNPYIIDGNLYMAGDNFLFAEQQYQNAIKINSRHFSPFDRLGDLYLKVQDYQASEKYFHEGAIRKLGLNHQAVVIMDSDADGVIDMFDKELNPLDTTIFGTDIISSFAFGKYYFDGRDFKNAERMFKKVVSLDVENPLVYHYLGQIAYADSNYAKAVYYFDLAIEFHMSDSLFQNHINKVSQGATIFPDVLKTYRESNFDVYDPNVFLARSFEKWGYDNDAINKYNYCIGLKPHYKAPYYMLWNLYKKRMELESAESVINMFGNTYPDELDRVLAEYYEWVLDTFKEDLQKTEQYAYKYGLLMHQFVMKYPEKYFAGFNRSIPESVDDVHNKVSFDDDRIVDMFTSFDSEIQMVDVEWKDPKAIQNPLEKGIEMFKKVESISVDKNVRADIFAKSGDFYLFSNDHQKALESYESSLSIKENNHSVRSMAAKCADHLYLFQKSFGHLTTLEQLNSLSYKNAIVLAQYYMKLGDKQKAINLSEKIRITHPFLKEEIEEDVIKLYLRFGDYQKTIELINQYIASDTTDMTMEYMLARSYAGLKKPQKALKHLQNADRLGFNLGFVYKNDTIFQPYRTLNKKWTAIQVKMEGCITSKM